MPTLTEFKIEEFAIGLLQSEGYHYLYGPDIAPDGPDAQRASFEDVVLINSLRESVYKINHTLPKDVCDEAINQVLRIASPDLLANNETFHRMMTEGISVSVHKDGAERGELVWLVDFENPYNNDFVAINQFTVIENGHNKRPDIVLFVNGLPLVVLELKNAMTKENVEGIVAVIKDLDYLDGTIFISFCIENLIYIKEIDKNLVCQYLSCDLDDLNKKMPTVLSYGMDLDLGYWILTEELVKEYKSKGLKINVWTPGNPVDGERLANWGVDYITSNILE